MPEHRGTRWRSGRRKLLGALGAGAGVAGGLGLPGLPGAAVAGAQAPGIAVTDADGRLGAVEAFRAAGTGLVEGAGVRWERLTFWWRGLQEGPGAPLNPFYFPLENVDAERERGMEVVGLLVNTPDWAAADPSRGGTSVPRNLYLPHDHPENYWGRFVRQVVELYRGRIDSWIIWNEPDITPNAPNAAYFLWAGSPADYYQLLKVATLNARAANPGVKILSAGGDLLDGHPLAAGAVVQPLPGRGRRRPHGGAQRAVLRRLRPQPLHQPPEPVHRAQPLPPADAGAGLRQAGLDHRDERRPPRRPGQRRVAPLHAGPDAGHPRASRPTSPCRLWPWASRRGPRGSRCTR